MVLVTLLVPMQDPCSAQTSEPSVVRALRISQPVDIDGYSRECLAITVGRSLKSDDVLETLTRLFAEHGPPAYIRSDNGPELTAKVVRGWLGDLELRTLFVEPGRPWEKGYNESFNGTLGEKVLKRETFFTLNEAKVFIEQ